MTLKELIELLVKHNLNIEFICNKSSAFYELFDSNVFPMKKICRAISFKAIEGSPNIDVLRVDITNSINALIKARGE